MNIVLIGYRGTGKSLVGKALAEMLDMTYISMDEEIVCRSGKSIPEIVEEKGWPGFRDLESELAAELSEKDNLLVDTGGGVIERPENMENLGERGTVIWLKAGVSTIVERISGDTERPSLTGEKSFTDEISEVLERRTPLYDKYSEFQVQTDSLTVKEICGKIIEGIEL